MSLGLNPMSFGLSGSAETTGQAIRDNATPREPAQDVPDQPVRELPFSGEQDR